MPLPNKKHLKHLKNKFILVFVKWMEDQVRYKRINVYIISVVALVAGIIGIYQIKISGSIIEDMPKKSEFFQDILFYEEAFNGIVPLEIIVDSKRKRYVKFGHPSPYEPTGGALGKHPRNGTTFIPCECI